MKTITKDEAATLIRASNGRVFTVTTVKRSTGLNRTFRGMLARNAKVGKVGGSLGYNADEKGLIGVYLMAGDENRDPDPKKDYRMLAIEGISYLALDGEKYDVK
jgi:hypothetical protein